MWFTPKNEREAKLVQAIKVERSKHDETKRQLAVLEAENKTLAAVVARDRARVEAEASAYARQKAENEHGQQS